MNKFTVTLDRTDSDTGGKLTIQRLESDTNKPFGTPFEIEVNDMHEVFYQLADWIGDNCEDIGEIASDDEDADDIRDEAHDQGADT